LPNEPKASADNIVSIDERPLNGRRELYIESIRCQYFPEISTWVSNIQDRYTEEMQAVLAAQRGDVAAEGAEAAEPSADDNEADAEESGGGQEIETPTLEGGGWVIELRGVHFHNQDGSNRAANYIRNELIAKLEWGSVELPSGPGKPLKTFTMKDLGIYYPVIIHEEADPNFKITIPGEPKPGGSVEGIAARSGQPMVSTGRTVSADAHRFTVEFAWQQIPLRQRLEKQQDQEAEASLAANSGGAGR
jgi:hypothetical protein